MLESTVRGSGQSSHARLLYGLTSTSNLRRRRTATGTVTDRTRVRQHRNADFTLPRVAKPRHDDSYVKEFVALQPLGCGLTVCEAISARLYARSSPGVDGRNSRLADTDARFATPRSEPGKARHRNIEPLNRFLRVPATSAKPRVGRHPATHKPGSPAPPVGPPNKQLPSQPRRTLSATQPRVHQTFRSSELRPHVAERLERAIGGRPVARTSLTQLGARVTALVPDPTRATTIGEVDWDDLYPTSYPRPAQASSLRPRRSPTTTPCCSPCTTWLESRTVATS